jgi:hypothetical protein
VHHRTIEINHQQDATIFQFIILRFIYSSTRFGRFPAHHKELNECSGSLWFYLRIVVTVVLCSWSGRRAGGPDHEHSTTVTMLQRARYLYKKSLLLARHFLGITPVSSISNGLYFLTLPLVSVTRVIYT